MRIARFEGNAELQSLADSPEEESDIPASSTTSTAATQFPMLEAARFILKLRDGNRLPQTVTNYILKDIQVTITPPTTI